MDFHEPPHLEAIRAEAEAFAAEHVTAEMVEEELRTGDGVSRTLLRAMGAKGWVAPMWPPEEGGAGLDPFETSAMLNAIRGLCRRANDRRGHHDAQRQRDKGLGFCRTAGENPSGCRRRRDADLPGLHRTRGRLGRVRLQDPCRP